MSRNELPDYNSRPEYPTLSDSSKTCPECFAHNNVHFQLCSKAVVGTQPTQAIPYEPYMYDHLASKAGFLEEAKDSLITTLKIFRCPVCGEDLRYGVESYQPSLPLDELAGRLEAHYAYHNLENIK